MRGDKRHRVESETTTDTEPQTTTDPPEITPSEQRVKSQVDTLESVERVFNIQGISMDVGPLVEKPVGGDIEMVMHFDYEDELTEEWPVISLTDSVDARTE